MLKLVIADDERVIRETISTIIDWKQYDIELVGLCKNGLEAYDAILDESPDIVLTDIRMPGMVPWNCWKNVRSWIFLPILSSYPVMVNLNMQKKP